MIKKLNEIAWFYRSGHEWYGFKRVNKEFQVIRNIKLIYCPDCTCYSLEYNLNDKECIICHKNNGITDKDLRNHIVRSWSDFCNLTQWKPKVINTNNNTKTSLKTLDVTIEHIKKQYKKNKFCKISSGETFVLEKLIHWLDKNDAVYCTGRNKDEINYVYIDKINM